MPEIWLSYGSADVVLDIRAENLETNITAGGGSMEGADIDERLGQLGPIEELAVLNDSPAVREVISRIFTACTARSGPPPRVLAAGGAAGGIGSALPEGAKAEAFDGLPGGSGRVFLAEMGLDGLFGYETVSTRLLRMSGPAGMLAAYSRRQGNLPAPGQVVPPMDEAKKHVDGLETRCIEVAAGPGGIYGMETGHPSKTASLSGAFESAAIRESARTKSMIISTGWGAAGGTLSGALGSLWSCMPAVAPGGLAVLLAESRQGTGSEAVQRHIEGRLGVDSLRNPPEYVSGMEDLLFLTESRGSFQMCLVSALPEFYAKALGMVPINGAGPALEYILNTQGPRQKVTVVSDGARVLLR
ncbi:hypothetical protein CENSYa_1687 [Cenarchaeum symbiosum A]|uniref:Uncharacterized protein n=1 Tax=Cenarchaeum symbiosum (strain A) TaxID=414004 RepID=A0RY86_CENSY|nr:hypothetical protein CENSYa_1687 [Cenarchaeum symbiosum A]